MRCRGVRSAHWFSVAVGCCPVLAVLSPSAVARRPRCGNDCTIHPAHRDAVRHRGASSRSRDLPLGPNLGSPSPGQLHCPAAGQVVGAFLNEGDRPIVRV
jgi:hypothetical protein